MRSHSWGVLTHMHILYVSPTLQCHDVASQHSHNLLHASYSAWVPVLRLYLWIILDLAILAPVAVVLLGLARREVMLEPALGPVWRARARVRARPGTWVRARARQGVG